MNESKGFWILNIFPYFLTSPPSSILVVDQAPMFSKTSIPFTIFFIKCGNGVWKYELQNKLTRIFIYFFITYIIETPRIVTRSHKLLPP